MSHQLQLTSVGGLSTGINSTTFSSGRRPHLYEAISRERWVEAIRRVLDGHYYCGQGTGPAVRNLTGCLIDQKAGNRAERGYVQVDPPCLTTAHKSEPKVAWQSAHRIICFLYKEPEDVEKLLYEKGYDASHRCHLSKCMNLDHMTIETHDENMSRRQCEGRVDVVTNVNDQLYLLHCPLRCPHIPPCINQREMRQAAECKQPEREEKQQETKQKQEEIVLD
jgi:hypothetical protein